MKEIEEYFKPLTKNGTQVGIGFDYTELSIDRSMELYPKNKRLREAFKQGFLEATQLNLMLATQNKQFEKSSKIIGIDGKAL